MSRSTRCGAFDVAFVTLCFTCSLKYPLSATADGYPVRLLQVLDSFLTLMFEPTYRASLKQRGVTVPLAPKPVVSAQAQPQSQPQPQPKPEVQQAGAEAEEQQEGVEASSLEGFIANARGSG